MRRHGSGALALALCLGLAASGCFTVQHDLPDNAYFGTLPAKPGETRQPFRTEAMKNWALAGLVPYSSYDTGNLVEPLAARRLEGVEVETRFSELDTLVWIVPGMFYGYYIWAPRTLSVSGTEVRDGDGTR